MRGQSFKVSKRLVGCGSLASLLLQWCSAALLITCSCLRSFLRTSNNTHPSNESPVYEDVCCQFSLANRDHGRHKGVLISIVTKKVFFECPNLTQKVRIIGV